MKVLLINPNFRGSKSVSDVNVRLRQPLDLAYLSAILEKKEIANEILDANVSDLSEKEILEKINGFSPSHIILTTSPLDRWECPQLDISMVFSLTQKIDSSIKLIICGTHGSVSPEWVRAKAGRRVDWVIKGEPEKSISDLFDGKTLKHEYNIYQSLDEIPFPNFSKLPMALYEYGDSELPKPFSILLSSRGCPFQCTFCLREMFKGYRVHSPERVVAEIKYLKDNYSINSIFFQDWEFLLDKERAGKIGALIKSNNLYVNFGFNARAQDLDFELMKNLQEAGLKKINVGLESASNKILKAVKKGTTKEDLARAAELSRKTGVKIGYYGLVNLPLEDIDTIKETARFVAKNNLEFGFGIVRPYPGTELALNYNINWENIGDNAGRIATEFPPASAILLHKFFIHYYRDGFFFILKPNNFKKSFIFLSRFLKEVHRYEMGLANRIIRKAIRGRKVALGIKGALRTCWLPYLKRKPQKIYLFPKWFWTCIFGAPHKTSYPWFSFEAVEWLESFLAKDMKVFEWGSGGSTSYFAKKVNDLISIESNPKWYKNVSEVIKKNNIANCRYLLKTPKASLAPNYPTTDSNYQGLDFEDYCRTIDEYPEDYFDLVVVDGLARPFCIRHALKKIKPGGFLFLDDSEQPRHTEGIAELKVLKRQDFTSPKFYIYRCHHVTIWQKPL